MIHLSLTNGSINNTNDLKYNINIVSILILEPVERNVNAEYKIRNIVWS